MADIFCYKINNISKMKFAFCNFKNHSTSIDVNWIICQWRQWSIKQLHQHAVILFWSSNWRIILASTEAGSFQIFCQAQHTDECECCSKLDGCDDGNWEHSLSSLTARKNVYSLSWVTWLLLQCNKEIWL